MYRSYAHPNGVANITWAELDAIFLHNEQTNAVAGICFGLCLVTLLNVVALTPRSKRSLPLYIFILIALGLLTARYLILMVLYTDLEVGSAYYNIAADYMDGGSGFSIVAIVFVIWLPLLAFLFVLLCLYVQGKCVLVLLQLRHHILYSGIMGYLLVLSGVATALRILDAAFVTFNQFDSYYELPAWSSTAVLITYTATILSWSLVFTVQVGTVIFNRYRRGGRLDMNEGLSILFMTGIESMLIPSEPSILSYPNLKTHPLTPSNSDLRHPSTNIHLLGAHSRISHHALRRLHHPLRQRLGQQRKPARCPPPSQPAGLRRWRSCMPQLLGDDAPGIRRRSKGGARWERERAERLARIRGRLCIS